MTAVEGLISQLLAVGRLEIQKNDYILTIIDQAKEMEKQQIKDAYQTSHISMMTAEQYYNETFKNTNK